jgi:hypothetical protein
MPAATLGEWLDLTKALMKPNSQSDHLLASSLKET